MPRKKSQYTAAQLILAVDATALKAAIAAVLSKEGGIMFGQTRDGSKVIVTTYLDGDKEQEYCDDPDEVVEQVDLLKAL